MLEQLEMGSKKVAENFTRAGNVNFNGNFCPVLQDKKFRYGTAGFRYPNEEMTFIAFRIGFLASLRARYRVKIFFFIDC